MFASISVADQWLGIGASIVAILTGVLVGLRYFVRQIINEVRPNGGESQKSGDMLLRTSTAVGEIRDRQSLTIEKLESHIANDDQYQKEVTEAVKALSEKRRWWH